MSQYDDPELQDIADKLTSDDVEMRRVGVLALVDSAEPEAAGLLTQALKDPDPSVRREAAKVVDEFESADIADALLAALGDSDEAVRNAAAHALADLKDTDAAQPLLDALQGSDDPFVIVGILGALKPMRLAESGEPALAFLQHTDAGVRREAVSVLGWLRSPANLPVLMERAREDVDPEVRRVAVSALSYGDPDSIGGALLAGLQDENWQVRTEAASMIGKLRLKAALQTLIEATRDSFWQVREKAVEALGTLRDPQAVEAVGVCTDDPVSNLRKAAVGALGEIGDSRAQAYVESALDDPDPDVRKTALWAQSKLRVAS
ncbi:HEAT repeat domain-containing protein [Thioalkalivibrio sp. ALM2T]|uniref:HEAT repeat domain-containing protein n=1 Tax=Thioalkalivibrio sp. ALM2T TaxID=1158184 RepID=UPI00036BCD37|nr:HEAT repeat domain-containing protein [Thioalkalivibrio sp. ALM2T]